MHTETSSINFLFGIIALTEPLSVQLPITIEHIFISPLHMSVCWVLLLFSGLPPCRRNAPAGLNPTRSSKDSVSFCQSAGVRWLGQHAGVAFEGAQGWRGCTWSVHPGEVELTLTNVYMHHVLQNSDFADMCCVLENAQHVHIFSVDHWKRFHSIGLGSPWAWSNPDPSAVL